jgi:anti-sigma factor RsiW
VSDAHSTVGAYAVDALSADERAEFESHLATCPSCQLEAVDFAETLAELSPLMAMAPPPALRTSVMAAIGGTRQLPRERVARAEGPTRPITEAGDEVPRRQRMASVTEIRPPGSPDEVAPLEEHPSVVPDTPWLGITASLSDDMDLGHRRRRDRVLALLVAAALVMAVVLSGWVYISWQSEQAQMVAAERETDLLTAPDAKVYSEVVDGTPVSFVVSKERNQALFIANGLPEPPKDSVYQLWTLTGETARPDELIRDGGSVRKWFDGPVGQSTSLAISVERAPDGSTTVPETLLLKVPIS